jgi:hypothetical protein
MAIVSANGAAAPLSPNYLINGAFDIWQRGAGPFTANVYGADRWQFYGTGTGTSHSATRQAFTPGSASVVGEEAQYYYRDVITSGSDANTQMLIVQKIEDVRTLAGKTVEFSFWAKAGSGTPKIGVEMYQNFGSGGSDAVSGIGQSVTLSTSWTRYSFTINVPSISGKTIGTDSSLQAIIWFSSGSANATRSGSVGLQSGTFDIWGAQVEVGSIATPFRRNANSIQGELAACKRYLPSVNAGTTLMGYAYTTNSSIFSVPFDVQARKAPTGIIVPTVAGGNFTIRHNTNGDTTITGLVYDIGGVNGATVLGASSINSGVASRLVINGGGYILFDGCEL